MTEQCSSGGKPNSSAAMLALSNEEREKWVRWATQLSVFTIVYNVVEGAVSVGLALEEESLSLLGFGLDSFIEVASACVVLWRFRGQSTKSEAQTPRDFHEKEVRATLVIGGLLVALSVAALGGAILSLAHERKPDSSIPGIAVSLASLSFMFFLWLSKAETAVALSSSTMFSDSYCSLGCIQLSGVLLVGSALHELESSLWWVDAVTTIIIAGFIFQEGYEALKAAKSGSGAGCCARVLDAEHWLVKRYRAKLLATGRFDPITPVASPSSCCSSSAPEKDAACCSKRDAAPAAEPCCSSTAKGGDLESQKPAAACCGSQEPKQDASASGGKCCSSKTASTEPAETGGGGCCASNKSEAAAADCCGSDATTTATQAV